jgi:hypothetical protein
MLLLDSVIIAHDTWNCVSFFDTIRVMTTATDMPVTTNDRTLFIRATIVYASTYSTMTKHNTHSLLRIQFYQTNIARLFLIFCFKMIK